MYDSCPVRCLAPNRDKNNGCPDCDYTVLWKRFVKEYEKAVKKEITREYEERGFEATIIPLLVESQLKTWSFENIFSDFQTYSALEEFAGTETGDSPGGKDPGWSIRTEAAIRIIRDERYKIRREAEYERDEEIKRKAKEKP